MQLCCSCGQTCFCVSRRQMRWSGFSITGPKVFFFYRGILKSCLVFSPCCLCWWIRGCVTERGRERESLFGGVCYRGTEQNSCLILELLERRKAGELCVSQLFLLLQKIFSRVQNQTFFFCLTMTCSGTYIGFACLVMINILSGSLYFVRPVCLVQV